MTPRISDKVSNLEDALSITINQIVYNMKRTGEDVITLSLGEAFFSIPLFDFNALDIEKIYHYSDTRGLPALCDKIAGFYGSQYGAPVRSNEILITAGSKPAIFMAAMAIMNPGDEALIHEPAWLSYPAHVTLAGGVAKYIPYDTQCADFERHFTPKTRLLIICNPNNPGGYVYSREELTTLRDMCLRRGVWLLVDEAYSDFIDEDRFVSMASVSPDKEGVIIANSLSKNMGMSGWRVGYTISNPAMTDVLEKLNQHIITCAPTILTHYMAHYFDDVIATTLPQVRQLSDKRRRIQKMLDELNIKYLPGGATFYFFVDLGAFPASSMDFAIAMLLDHNISVVPGSAYGKSVEHFVRVSFGTESEERIYEALVLMRQLICTSSLDVETLRKRFWDSPLSNNVAPEIVARGVAEWRRG